MVDNSNDTKDALDRLIDGLNEGIKAGKTDLLAKYFDVSQAFPGGPHEKSFDYKAIDFKALKQWADKNNWLVATAPEKTHETQQSTPMIRFTKKS